MSQLVQKDHMMKGLVVDENMSNLTSASSEISASPRNDTTGSLHPPHQYSSTSTNQEPQPKRKRSLPGHPDPEAEVIALSPKTLLATNRFVCEICNKGFQRDQNLQLHRRGHNLPWKLKQRSKETIRKKVYVCPEPACVHHDPSRALGDLTGIKKHFCRKHGEKKWKCDKCSKRYAVQSDWKAHSKICGTREYKCDCGTLFSRRDSFITHRAFCDALAQESARAITGTATNPPTLSSHTQYGFQQHPSVKRELQEFNLRAEIPPWWSFSSSPHLDENPNPTMLLPSFQYISSPPHMSATALLQKASQIGVTVSKTTPASSSSQANKLLIRPHLQQAQAQAQAHHVPDSMASSSANSAVFGLGMPLASREEIGTVVGIKAGNGITSDYLEEADIAAKTVTKFHDMMAATVPSISFEEAIRGMLFLPTRDNNNNNNNFQELVSKSTGSISQFSKSNKGGGTASASTGGGGANDEMTRDFLGLGAFSQRDFFNISGLEHLASSSYGKQNHNQAPWQG